MRRLALLCAATVAVLAIASACTQQKFNRPSIRIVEPVDGSTVNSQSLFVKVAVDHFTIVPTQTQNIGEAFKGHWVLFADGVPLAPILTTSAAVSAIPIGTHVFSALLVNENETPVSGAAVANAQVTIPDGAPGVIITSPVDGATVNSSSVEMPLDVSNFTLDSANLGGPNVDGEGHYQVRLGSLDASPWEEDWVPNLTVTDLDASAASSKATFEVWVSLVNDDGTPLDPPVFDDRQVQIPKDSPRLSLLSPADGAVIGSSFSVALSVANFSLVDFAGSPADSAGQGHYRVVVDGSDLGPAFATTTNGWSSRGPGEHHVRVELVSNTGVPLSPPVADVSRVSVP